MQLYKDEEQTESSNGKLPFALLIFMLCKSHFRVNETSREIVLNQE